MNRNHALLGIFSLIGLILAYSPALASAEHLDRVETRRNIRHLSERTDDLQDRLEGWMEDGNHHEERMHKAEELSRHIDSFETNLMTLRLAVIQHEELWDVREQATAVVDSARELHRALEHADFLPGEVTADWKEMHELVNTLAQQYHLEQVR